MEKQCGEYEALQTQRAKEREIRAIKRELAGYQGVMLGTDDENLLNEAQNKFTLSSKNLKDKEKELQDFVEQTGLKRNNERERVAGFNKSISQKAVKANEKISYASSQKSAIINPEYIRLNVSTGIDATSDVDTITNTIVSQPTYVRNLLENTEWEIFSKGNLLRGNKIVENSFYDRKNNKIYILSGADNYEIIHEIGHVVETRGNVLEDKEYLNIRADGLSNALKTFEEYPGLENNYHISCEKFISYQQGRLYEYDMKGNYVLISQDAINYNCLGEYFSEGYREYFENNNNLKLKDIKLYNYIKELIENE